LQNNFLRDLVLVVQVFGGLGAVGDLILFFARSGFYAQESTDFKYIKIIFV